MPGHGPPATRKSWRPSAWGLGLTMLIYDLLATLGWHWWTLQHGN
ncbi:hypothetical protein ACFSC4_02215 [Deinococcus malanensis]